MERAEVPYAETLEDDSLVGAPRSEISYALAPTTDVEQLDASSLLTGLAPGLLGREESRSLSVELEAPALSEFGRRRARTAPLLQLAGALTGAALVAAVLCGAGPAREAVPLRAQHSERGFLTNLADAAGAASAGSAASGNATAASSGNATAAKPFDSGVPPGCHTAAPGEDCFNAIQWAMVQGVFKHPQWYAGLSASSTFEEFQRHFSENSYRNCTVPCEGSIYAGSTLAPVPSTSQLPFYGWCNTAVFGSECYNKVLWVLRYGIVLNPYGYPGISISSSFEEVQAAVHDRGEGNCGPPCQAVEDPSKSASPEGAEDLGHLSDVICNAGAALPAAFNASTRAWQVSEQWQKACLDGLQMAKSSSVQGVQRTNDRNWCWVGLKEAGCHGHFYDHLSWPEMQKQAVIAGVTASIPYEPLLNRGLCDKPENGGSRAWMERDWALSQEWLRKHVAVLVLSLPNSTESSARRFNMQVRLEELDIPFQFVDGLDMRQENAYQKAKDEGLIPPHHDLDKAEKWAKEAKEGMGLGSILGTVGCASGHFRAQDAGVKMGSWITVVFEDDVSPEFDFVPRLWRMFTQEVPCDWQAVSLYSRCPFGECVGPHLTRVQPDVNEPAWRCRHGVNYGFQGMAYRTKEIPRLQKVWKPVVFDEERPHCIDVDVALASISDKVNFYAVPSSQAPGLLHELSEGSARWEINVETTTTTLPPEDMRWSPSPVSGPDASFTGTTTLAPGTVLKASGFSLGQNVTWSGVDRDIPEGSVGSIVAFKDSGISVRFGNGTWNFLPDELTAAPGGGAKGGSPFVKVGS